MTNWHAEWAKARDRAERYRMLAARYKRQRDEARRKVEELARRLGTDAEPVLCAVYVDGAGNLKYREIGAESELKGFS